MQSEVIAGNGSSGETHQDDFSRIASIVPKHLIKRSDAVCLSLFDISIALNRMFLILTHDRRTQPDKATTFG